MMSEATDKTLQQQFYLQFQASRTSLAARLEACKNIATSRDEWEEMTFDIRKLGKSLTDATSFLSAYDQRQCREQMDTLERTLEEVRSTLVPKTKFTFKRKTDKPRLSAAPALLPSPSAKELGERDAVPDTSTFHRLSTQSRCRLSLQSIPMLATGAPLSDLTISDLDHCIVDLCGTADTMSCQDQLCLTALHVRDLKETILILPNVKGSVLLHNLHRCTVIVACHQFRMHNSIGVRAHLATISNPVIENCSAIAFAEHPSFLSPLSPSINEAPPPKSKHADVQDFSHIGPTPSPNWFLLPPGNENWEDLSTLDDSSPQGLDAVLAAHLPEATSNIQ